MVTYLSHGKPSKKSENDKDNTNEDLPNESSSSENDFLINLNQLVSENKIDKIIGRKKEIERLVQILSRRNKK